MPVAKILLPNNLLQDTQNAYLQGLLHGHRRRLHLAAFKVGVPGAVQGVPLFQCGYHAVEGGIKALRRRDAKAASASAQPESHKTCQWELYKSALLLSI